ncbi:MAG: branched-chain amino acid ABC transporter permease [Gaiellaceae bacterium]
MRRLAELSGLVAPVLLLALVGVVGTFTSRSVQFQFRFALVMATIVIALYVFVGNSGVVSFGHVSFVAVGGFAAGLTTVPEALKLSLSPDLFPFIASAEVGNALSLLIAAVVGGVFALIVGVPLMRLSGLSAGIATFAVLVITNNVLRNWEAIGPGARTLSLVPETTGFLQATIGVIAVAALAFLYQRSRFGRVLRASSDDPAAAQGAGVDIYRQRLLAFTLSGALAGFAGGLLVHLLGSITTQQVYLDLAFLTLAMLVIGGVRSLWGAVVGALLVSGINSLLLTAERGLSLGVTEVTVPTGTRLVTLGAVMALILLFRPRGVTGGRELSLR